MFTKINVQNAKKCRDFLIVMFVTSNALRSLTIAPISPHHNPKSLQKFTKVYKKMPQLIMLSLMNFLKIFVTMNWKHK